MCRFHVYIEIGSIAEVFTTLQAGEPLAPVNNLVHRQVSTVWKTLATRLASERLVVLVDEHVTGQISRVNKTLVADLARMRSAFRGQLGLLSGRRPTTQLATQLVSGGVDSQLRLVQEHTSAQVANDVGRRQTATSAAVALTQMDVEVLLVPERASALDTVQLSLELVRAHVTSQVTTPVERRSAYVADERFAAPVDVRLTTHKQMFAESLFRPETLVALFADERTEVRAHVSAQLPWQHERSAAQLAQKRLCIVVVHSQLVYPIFVALFELGVAVFARERSFLCRRRLAVGRLVQRQAGRCH